MYNKTIIEFGFCDIRNNQGLPAASVISLGLRPQLITLASTLIIPDITKTSFNYCLELLLITVECGFRSRLAQVSI